ncbi:hypothetical protein TA3x_005092 [Tundrisphaera sp. TA3]|uniref:hypothetical protein n=1 Tax=Tundrisphaera sp. TA3 TaxID=3435775 RepID=UPI003EC000EC
MGRAMPWIVSLILIAAGIFFGAQSESNYSSRTLWGYAMMGMTSLLLGTGFAFSIWWRDSGPTKGGARHPLD